MLLKKSAANSVCTDVEDAWIAVVVLAVTAPLLLRRFFDCGVESSPVVSGFIATGVIDLDLEQNNTRMKYDNYIFGELVNAKTRKIIRKKKKNHKKIGVNQIDRYKEQ